MVATTREAKLTEIYESLDLDLELSLDVPGRNLDEIWTKSGRHGHKAIESTLESGKTGGIKWMRNQKERLFAGFAGCDW